MELHISPSKARRTNSAPSLLDSAFATVPFPTQASFQWLSLNGLWPLPAPANPPTTWQSSLQAVCRGGVDSRGSPAFVTYRHSEVLTNELRHCQLLRAYSVGQSRSSEVFFFFESNVALE